MLQAELKNSLARCRLEIILERCLLPVSSILIQEMERDKNRKRQLERKKNTSHL